MATKILGNIISIFGLFMLALVLAPYSALACQEVAVSDSGQEREQKVRKKAEILKGDVVYGVLVREVSKTKVVRVIDGDSIEFLQDIGGQKIPWVIRLDSIEAPEMLQGHGIQSKKVLEELVLGKEVRVLDTGIERDNLHILAFIEVDGKNVNAELVRTGNAWHYPRQSTSRQLAKLQTRARSKKQGLWAKPDPIPPWLYGTIFEHGYFRTPGVEYQWSEWDREIAESYVTTCVKVASGDTITVLDKNAEELTVRLDLIDCPEFGQPYAREAKQAMTEMVLDKRVRVFFSDKTREGMPLVFLENFPEDESLEASIEISMVRRGLAWVERDNTSLKAPGWSEDVARKEKVGLWSEPNPTPPWEYLKK